MYGIGFVILIIGGCCLDSEKQVYAIAIMIPGAILILAKYLLERKRTWKSCNSYKFK